MHLRNFNVQRMEQMILGAGEIIGEEALYEDNADVDIECIVYKCSKHALRMTCESLPNARRFIKKKIEAKRALICDMKNNLKGGIKSKNVDMLDKKLIDEKSIQVTVNHNTVKDMAFNTLEKPSYKPNISSSKKLNLMINDVDLTAKHSKDIPSMFVNNVTRTKINDSSVVFNKKDSL